MSEDKDDSEERKLPPTEHKLKEARKKGQISHCPDLVNATSLTAAIAYLWITWPDIIDKLTTILILPANTYGQGFDKAVETLLTGTYQLAWDVVIPLALIVIIVSLITNMALIKGLLFAVEPIVPKANKINPAKGFKKIFSLRNWIELLKSIVKTALIFALVFFLSWLTIGDVLKSPYCGMECVSVIFGDLMRPILVVVLLVFMIVALNDIGVQRWLFLRDMRMTRTEWKREHKDTEGDPLIKDNRKLRGQELIEGEAKLMVGLRHATFVIVDKADVLIGLHFIQHVTTSPIVVSKSFGEAVGEPIDEELFHAVAQAMIISGAL